MSLDDSADDSADDSRVAAADIDIRGGDDAPGHEPDTAEAVFGRPPTRRGDESGGEGPPTVAARAQAGDAEPLIGPDQLEALQRRWGAAQAGFVDDPRRAVEVAYEIAATAAAALQSAVEDRLGDLSAWRDDDEATTDQLLAAFQGYRAVFDGVMSA